MAYKNILTLGTVILSLGLLSIDAQARRHHRGDDIRVYGYVEDGYDDGYYGRDYDDRGRGQVVIGFGDWGGRYSYDDYDNYEGRDYYYHRDWRYRHHRRGHHHRGHRGGHGDHRR